MIQLEVVFIFCVFRHVDGSKEEHFFSEDSESTQGSDLDHELNIKVLLPNQSMQTLSVLARLDRKFF